jgi:hypothetical protein
MSAEQVIVALLLGDPALGSLVPAGRIYPGVIPQTAALPALAYSHVSSVERPTLSAREATTTVTSRIQVTVAAKTYPDQKRILDAVRVACNNQRGSIGGVAVLNVRRESVGPDFENVEASVYSLSIDFKVTFNEARIPATP